MCARRRCAHEYIRVIMCLRSVRFENRTAKVEIRKIVQCYKSRLRHWERKSEKGLAIVVRCYTYERPHSLRRIVLFVFRADTTLPILAPTAVAEGVDPLSHVITTATAFPISTTATTFRISTTATTFRISSAATCAESCHSDSDISDDTACIGGRCPRRSRK